MMIVDMLRAGERSLKYPTAALCLYEAIAIACPNRRTPTVTRLSAARPWLAVAVSVLVYAHLRWSVDN